MSYAVPDEPGWDEPYPKDNKKAELPDVCIYELKDIRNIFDAVVNLRENTGGDFYAELNFDGKWNSINVYIYDQNKQSKQPVKTFEIHIGEDNFESKCLLVGCYMESLIRRYRG